MPRHRLCMTRPIPGVLTCDVVKSKHLNRPTKRLRFKPDGDALRFPDLYDVQIESISTGEFVFSGIEAPGPGLGVALEQHYAQAWTVSVNEPEIARYARERSESRA